MVATFTEFPKINSCTHCKGTGKIQYHKLDGQTIYHWQKPVVETCSHCRGREDV